MPGSCERKDGLLLLLQAAKKLDEYEPSRPTTDCWDRKSQSRFSYDYKDNPANVNGYIQSKKPIGSTRCSHNELEKSRRAHLRSCMESLKEQLNFDSGIPRVTMLAVLKKATTTILYLRQKNLRLETYEDNEKQRYVQLLKKRQFLKKKLEEKRNRAMKLQSWRERNRNCSECSIATTSSDDSELELHLRNGTHSALTASFGSSAEKSQELSSHLLITDISTVGFGCKPKKNFVYKHDTRPPSGLDVYDASSSDSGFEEITIAPNGNVLPEDTPTVYCLTAES